MYMNKVNLNTNKTRFFFTYFAYVYEHKYFYDCLWSLSYSYVNRNLKNLQFVLAWKYSIIKSKTHVFGDSLL